VIVGDLEAANERRSGDAGNGISPEPRGLALPLKLRVGPRTAGLTGSRDLLGAIQISLSPRVLSRLGNTCISACFAGHERTPVDTRRQTDAPQMHPRIGRRGGDSPTGRRPRPGRRLPTERRLRQCPRLVEEERGERAAEVVWTCVLDAGAVERPPECPPPPRLVRRLGPDRAVRRREDQCFLCWPPAPQSPFAEIGGECRQQPNCPMRGSFRVLLLAGFAWICPLSKARCRIEPSKSKAWRIATRPWSPASRSACQRAIVSGVIARSSSGPSSGSTCLRSNCS
jgi:hypothetical protein